ncbi:MAG: acetyl-CoA carboxylase carboxyl transferase subunit beta [Fusobacteriia bacterium 4572_132]|nr:MAG: acetyl-CoA carboxylase carboxyl transferase subunit beta [Fusobacteriia bacterium 4572_132]
MGIFSSKNKYATLYKKKEMNTKEEILIKNKNKKQKEKMEMNKAKGLWTRCTNCNEIIYMKEINENNKECPKCKYYFRMNAKERIELLSDEGTFKETNTKLLSKNFMNFPGYEEKLERAEKKSKLSDAVVTGIAKIKGIEISLAVMDFNFMGGSMGSVVGEKITRAIELGIEKKCPVIIVSTSGGARMHESVISLMQMAKTSAALERLRTAGLPFISIPVNPTTGGVTASFAMLGDVIITEKNALIAFAGPRVIEQTIKQKLPEGFQKAEFLLEHGMVDIVVKRSELKEITAKVLANFGFGEVK